MKKTYQDNAEICARFYDLSLDSVAVASFVRDKANYGEQGGATLFVGGMFGVAERLRNSNDPFVVVDYSEEMVTLGRRRLPGVRVECADLRNLPFKNEFSTIFVIGRVFTHMLRDEDVEQALRSCYRALVPGGTLFFDNYEDSRIQATSYFNGEISVSDQYGAILRRSTTQKVSDAPFVVKWNAEYSGDFRGERFHFCDEIAHRAFSRVDIAANLFRSGFTVIEQGDNFDETSFFTRAERNR